MITSPCSALAVEDVGQEERNRRRSALAGVRILYKGFIHKAAVPQPCKYCNELYSIRSVAKYPHELYLRQESLQQRSVLVLSLYELTFVFPISTAGEHCTRIHFHATRYLERWNGHHGEAVMLLLSVCAQVLSDIEE